MAIITGLEENRGRIEVIADGCTIARIRKTHFEKCPLSVGEEVDIDEYIDRLAAIQFADGYECALSSLDLCARSAQEIGNSLRRRGYVAPAIEAIIARLMENHLIDDRQYAQRLAEIQSQRSTGIYAVKRKLRAKGISEEDVEDALAVFDEDQQRHAALLAAQKLARRYENLPMREARAKLSQALMRRGFSWDSIESVVESLFDE